MLWKLPIMAGIIFILRLDWWAFWCIDYFIYLLRVSYWLGYMTGMELIMLW